MPVGGQILFGVPPNVLANKHDKFHDGIREREQMDDGACSDWLDCFVLDRGVKTRWDRCCLLGLFFSTMLVTKVARDDFDQRRRDRWWRTL